ncbi:response regulator [Clostridium baratii]|nr:response regulator [Clostridium baratii]MDU1854160.1 response regulator [Clostridium baratii]
MRVLVIEDERVQRDNLVKIVERSYINTKAYSAANIKEAKEILTSKEIDLFFIDINLPDGSGLELAKSIRKIEEYEHTGIVFITTQVIQIIDAFKSTHCYDFLIKPFNNEDIKAIIDTFYRKLGINTNVNKGNYLIVPIENGVSVKV